MAVDTLKRYKTGEDLYPRTVLNAIKVTEDSGTTLDEVIDNLSEDLIITIPNTDWTNNSDTTLYPYRYYKTYTDNRIKESYNPLYAAYPINGSQLTDVELKAFDSIGNLVTYNGYLRVYSDMIPTSEFKLALKGVPVDLNIINDTEV